MATKAEELNLAQFKETYAQVTPGIPGAKFEGGLFGNARKAAEASATLLDQLTPGKSGVRFEGPLYGMLRRTEYNSAQAMTNAAATNATIQGLVGAIKAMSTGESFDEAKLLDSIGKATREAFDAALKAAAPAEVTLQVEAPEAAK